MPDTQSPPEAIVMASQKPANKSKAGLSKGLIIGAVLLVILAASVFGLNKFTGIFSQASGECLPQNVQATDLAANSGDIVFQTDSTCQVEVAYGTSNQPEALLLQVQEKMASLNHRVRLSPLLPATTYYYQIKYSGKPVGQINSFLTLASSPATTPSPKPQAVSPTSRPTVVPTTASGAKPVYTLKDFEAKFGTKDKTFDIDNNGVVNTFDWFAYQK